MLPARDRLCLPVFSCVWGRATGGGGGQLAPGLGHTNSCRCAADSSRVTDRQQQQQHSSDRLQGAHHRTSRRARWRRERHTRRRRMDRDGTCHIDTRCTSEHAPPGRDEGCQQAIAAPRAVARAELPKGTPKSRHTPTEAHAEEWCHSVNRGRLATPSEDVITTNSG